MSEKKRGFFGRLFGGKETPETPETEAPLVQDAEPEADLGSDAGADVPDATAPLEPALPVEEKKAEDEPETLVAAPAQSETGTSAEEAAISAGLPDTSVDPSQGLEPEEEIAPKIGSEEELPVDELVPEQAADERTAVPAPVVDEPAPARKQSWFQRLKQGLSRSSSALTEGISSIFTKRKLDAAMLEDLEDVLIQADLGVATSMSITERLADGRFDKEISPEEVRSVLAEEVEKVLAPVAQPLDLDSGRKPHVVLMVGVNGTGKTTTIGKLSQKLAREGKSVMLAAGDTFRAAAVEQLKIWGKRTGAEVVAGETGADAAGLAFDAMKRAKEKAVDVLLIDTAGRLQNKTELMDELEKVIRVIKKHDPEAPHTVLLTLDATTGQNALSQVEIFGRVAGVTGLVMTKLDGTARGGILVAIAAKHKLPVHFIGVGEGVEDLEPFSASDFAKAIAGLA
ncbi:signal recognition particle-docking protein FtsY [Roseibium suaedae]|uniref:Signal recognition particle receptor FtsY n=1 Tax=Roseibium suaedae TaxID=735517 RepID=A0A1M7N005_9HYPH|nr:signal recognition particle-docking protein FtsY [Roseibium suaedae]SHM96244.1 signal recognition particle-docking protein FtsY [Roseibium suaedae]